jgi:aminoglycoside phosphotransferase family enzyme
MIPQTSKRLIQSLTNPSLYSDGGEKTEVKETHMSWVILAGPYAYKIKKPLDRCTE